MAIDLTMIDTESLLSELARRTQTIVVGYINHPDGRNGKPQVCVMVHTHGTIAEIVGAAAYVNEYATAVMRGNLQTGMHHGPKG